MVTIEDVAKICGVSPMTISRVVNGSDLVKESTRKKVLDAIKETGYRPNMIARRLVQGNSKTIGVLFSNYYNQAYTDILFSIEEVAYRNGYNVINANVDDYEHAVNSLTLFLGNMVDGIIVLPLEMNMLHVADYKQAMVETQKFLEYFYDTVKKQEVSVVTVSQNIEDVFNIAFNFTEMAQKAMDYLFMKGYKDIAMINSNLNDGFWVDKERVYLQSMKEKGYEKYICIERDIGLMEGGNRAMERLLGKKIPQAVFCANDYIAIGALQTISKHKLTIPGEIAVIGNDNVYFCEMTAPKLTTVSLNAKLAGKVAMERMLKLLNGEKLEGSEYVVETELIIRESV